MKNKTGIVWIFVSAICIVIDQLSKAWVLGSLPEYMPQVVIPGFWNWYRTYNTGAAFSFLSDAGGWQQWFFLFSAFIVCAVLVYRMYRTPRTRWQINLPYALIVGGALGNCIDRLWHGYVIDFIQWHIGKHYWPAFNIADSSIVVGAISIIVLGFFESKTAHQQGIVPQQHRPTKDL